MYMKYRIKDCVVYGIRRPFMFFGGWIEKKAEYIDVRVDGKTVYRHDLDQTASKIKAFNIKTAIHVDKRDFTLHFFACDKNSNECEIYVYESKMFDRIKKRFTPNWNSEESSYVKRLNKEIKNAMGVTDIDCYHKWISKYEVFSPVEKYEYNPLISIVMPVYNVPAIYLRACLNSILQQTYQNFEICIADDCSTHEDTIAVLKEYLNLDSRIKVIFREKNGHISEATNTALQLAEGEFVGLMDNDDELMPQALNEVVRVLNQQPDLDFVYSDEDKIDLKGVRSDPHFKADFAKDTFYGGNYICHFSVIRKSIIEEVGGFRKGYEGAQDFDLFLRISEITDKFYHISKILYHWRMIPGSTALDSKSKNYAGEAGKRALEDLFKKKDINVNVNIMVNTHYFVEYLLDYQPSIDIIMQVNDMSDDFFGSLQKMDFELEYSNYRYIFFSERSNELSQILGNILPQNKYRVLKSSDNLLNDINVYCSTTDSEILLFMKEDCEIECFNALEVLAGYVKREDIGVAGVKIQNKKGWTLDTGYFVTNKKMLSVHKPSFSGDYGIYGNLLVPFNYRVIEHECFAVEKKDFLSKNGFNSEFDFRTAAYDLCMRMYNSKKRNIIIPHVEVYCSCVEDYSDEHKSSLINYWDSKEIDVNCDPYYNRNFSVESTHRLPK